MTTYAKSIDISAPPERVWAVMTEVERWHEWTPSITRIARLDSGPFTVGSRVRVVQPRLRPAVFTVTEVNDRPERRSFTWRMSAPGVVGIATHIVEPGPAGAHATLLVEFAGLLGGLVGRLYGGLTERYLALEADGLKRRSEPMPER
jgi:uncharacterized protein YndB with AHSA1/START domain